MGAERRGSPASLRAVAAKAARPRATQRPSTAVAARRRRRGAAKNCWLSWSCSSSWGERRRVGSAVVPELRSRPCQTGPTASGSWWVREI